MAADGSATPDVHFMQRHMLELTAWLNKSETTIRESLKAGGQRYQ
jgi:hypothetical protein